MRVLMMAGAACCVLAACSPETPAPGEASAPSNVVMPEGENAAEAPPAAVDCKDIQTVLAAADESVPFTSLRTGNVSLAGQPQPDMFTTSIAPAGAKQCQIGEVPGSGGTQKIHVVNCILFTSGATDREKNAELAKQVFNAARTQFTACLPAHWTSRTGATGAVDATEAMIYESKADAQRAMTASFYTYPVQLKKQWVEGGNGETPGWRVTLDFQKDAKQ